MKKLEALLFLFLSHFSFSQKIEVVKESGFKHNYAIGWFFFIEDAIDTSRLNYVGTLRFSCERNIFVLSQMLDKLKFKAKELGANSFRPRSIVTNDNLISIESDVYFSGENHLKQNEAAKKRNCAYLFNATWKPVVMQEFYLDGLRKELYPASYSCIKCAPGKKIKLRKYEKFGRRITLKGRENAESAFIGVLDFKILPKDQLYTSKNPFIQNVSELFLIDYNLGRLLLTIYKAQD